MIFCKCVRSRDAVGCMLGGGHDVFTVRGNKEPVYHAFFTHQPSTAVAGFPTIHKRRLQLLEIVALIYLLTPRSRVLLEKLTGLQLVKFPAFYGTRRCITALTSFRHPSVSWASPIQSTYPQPTSWRSILILSTHLCLIIKSLDY